MAQFDQDIPISNHSAIDTSEFDFLGLGHSFVIIVTFSFDGDESYYKKKLHIIKIKKKAKITYAIVLLE